MRKQAHDGTTDDEYLITLKVLQQMIRLAELLVAGTHADADYVEAEVHAPYRAVSPFRTVTADEYRAIGRSCTENEQWRAVYETIAPGLSTYQRDAIEAYATTRLS
ncbi:TipAS antibiotic-recognition domain-containing protein [Streptomyces sp. NPDC093109]|uniref:TipAS antibiotic-recognition domain-containing protein n=1 Tax=Streptomyces sp. NPDC093109 TaxID=3154977 RepID=UPI00344D6384